jgi:hypothetical protein
MPVSLLSAHVVIEFLKCGQEGVEFLFADSIQHFVQDGNAFMLGFVA